MSTFDSTIPLASGPGVGKLAKHALTLAAKRSWLGPGLRKLRGAPRFARAIELGRRRGWEVAAEWQLSEEGRPTLSEPATLRGLTQDVVLDVEVELLLTAVRKKMLLGPPGLLQASDLQDFIVAVILQNNLNEFVWYVSDIEKEELGRVRAQEGGLDAGKSAFAARLVKLALYQPIHSILKADTQPQECGLPAVLAQQVLESRLKREQESALAGSTERFGQIEDNVSVAVSSMYEANPYPQWTAVPPVLVGRRRAHVASYFPDLDLSFMDRPFDVLVAGCGTGYQALICALGYGKNANVTAIDISGSSIAYARRRASEHGVKNIRFIQADILDFPKMGMSFDVVESTGVLHHLRNPFEGFAAVTSCLRPGGLFHCSVYAELGRRNITQLRTMFMDGDTKISDDDIRRYRRALVLASDPGEVWRRSDPIPFVRDFFSLNNCRDLIFHVNEHVFTIPRLEDYMNRLDLQFHGFVAPPLPGHQYWPRLPNLTELDGWWRFEQDNPNTFFDCYVFWCRKNPISA